MAAPRLIRWIVQDWWLKLIALAAGIVLWLFARLDQEYTKELLLALDFSLLSPEYVVVEKTVDSVRVEVKAKGRDLIRLGREKPRVILPLATMKEGTERLRVGPENVGLPEEIQIRSLDPYQIELRIERRASRRIKIIVSVVGQPASKFAISAIEYDNNATLYGTKEAVSTINQLFVDSLDVEQVSESFKRELRIQLPDAAGLTVVPSSVLVSVVVEPETTVVFQGVPVEIKGRPLRGQAYLVDTEVRLTLKGPVSLLRAFRKEDVRVSIDISSMSLGEDRRVPADVSLPPTIRVERSDPEIFRVLVR